MGLKPGKYLGKIVDYGVGPTRQGLPQIIIKFEWPDLDGVYQSIMWFGSLKGGAIPITLGVLLDLGFKGDDPEELAKGFDSGLLNIEQEYELTIEEHEYEGKKFMRCQYINLPGASAIRDRMSKEEMVQKTQGLNLKAELAAVRAKRSQPVVVGAAAPMAVPF